VSDERRWIDRLLRVAESVEDGVDLVRYGIRGRLGGKRALRVAAYRTFGTPRRVRVAGRVLRDEGLAPSVADASAWRNLVDAYRRFETDEVPGARVAIAFRGVRVEASADREGYFEHEIDLPNPVSPGVHDARVTLLEPHADAPVAATARVHVPAETARFGVVSDIDDTVIRTDVTDVVRMVRAVLLGNAHTRLPFPGVADLYRALRAGPGGACDNPLFYVSSSPWNLYDLLEELFALRDIPPGPLLLRDWGLGGEVPTQHAGHKRAAIARIFETYAALPFILVGDSGQQDPEIYAALMREHPHRVLAAYIRDVHPEASRRDAIRRLAAELAKEGGTLVLTPDTAAAALHARQHGWTD
jgi:phosphatidate phosphatase APP1